MDPRSYDPFAQMSLVAEAVIGQITSNNNHIHESVHYLGDAVHPICLFSTYAYIFRWGLLDVWRNITLIMSAKL